MREKMFRSYFKKVAFLFVKSIYYFFLDGAPLKNLLHKKQFFEIFKSFANLRVGFIRNLDYLKNDGKKSRDPSILIFDN